MADETTPQLAMVEDSRAPESKKVMEFEDDAVALPEVEGVDESDGRKRVGTMRLRTATVRLSNLGPDALDENQRQRIATVTGMRVKQQSLYTRAVVRPNGTLERVFF